MLFIGTGRSRVEDSRLGSRSPYNVCHMPLNPLARFRQPKPPMLITGSAELESLCRKFAGRDFVGVDTEFLRRSTYRAKLCLVQLASGNDAAAIDVLAPGIDLAPLYELMLNRRVTKVFHSASQDLELFHLTIGEVPQPVFDTQIAAMVCGYGEQPSYAHMVEEVEGVVLAKSAQRSDWSRRPLTASQIDYAVQDVAYLGPIYRVLSKRLKKSGREEWVASEMALLTDKDTYKSEPRDAWLRISFRRPSRQALAVLREVATWREMSADRLDLPRTWIMKDSVLTEIALKAPRTKAELGRVRGVPEKFVNRRGGRELLRAVNHALDSDPAEWPEVPEGSSRPRARAKDVTRLQALLKECCQEHEVAPGFVANRDELTRMAVGDYSGIRALGGWRKVVFGDAALSLIHGDTGADGVQLASSGVISASVAE